ncbi:MAG: M28 family peptidase [Planctomycetota bacterium]
MFPTRGALFLTVGLLLAPLPPAQAPIEAPTQAPTASDAPEPIPQQAPAGMERIDRADLRKHAVKLASDEFGGRYTGSDGQVAAARYIAAHFEQLGLRPRGEKTNKGWSFFMRYPVARTELDPKRTRIVVGSAEFTTGFAVIRGKKNDRVDLRGRFVWCGSGGDEDLPRGVANVIPVVVLAGGANQGRALREGFKSAGITRALADRGAKAVVFCMLDDRGAAAEAFNYSTMLAGKPMLQYGQGPRRSVPPGNVPAVYVNRKISEALFAALGVDVQGDVARPPKNIKRASGRLQLDITEDPKSYALNVVGCVEGSDPSLRDEAVVFSAHMDHMGTRIDGDAFNGADDNASGTSGLLELAEAVAKGSAPRRSVLFVSVSGEEEGLWGSHWFSENPTWELQKLVADVNIDMIGRVADLSGTHGISMTPSYRHNEFNTLVRDAARLAQDLGITELTSGDTYYERSDHYNFARKGVPVVFFCDGEHEDYHRVTDHADKLDFAKMERVTRLAYWVGIEAANAKGRPQRLGAQDGW